MLHKAKLIPIGFLALAVAIPVAATEQQMTPSFVKDDSLTVCMDATFPPMEFMKNSEDRKPSGLDVDLSEALANYWGVELHITRMNFSGLLPGLASQRCDAVISGVTRTQERMKTFDAIPYLGTDYVVAAATGTPDLNSQKDLAGLAIAVESGTTYPRRLKAINKELEENGLQPIHIALYPTQTAAIQQLMIGRVDAVVSQDTEMAYRRQQNPGRFKVIWHIDPGGWQPYSIYIRPDDDDKRAVAAAIAALKEDGTLNKIAEKWNIDTSLLEKIGNS